MLRFLLPLSLLAVLPALARADDAVVKGKLTHLDPRTRVLSLSDGRTYAVNKRVKISTRSVGEAVVLTLRTSNQGCEVVRIRPAPIDPPHRATTVASKPPGQ